MKIRRKKTQFLHTRKSHPSITCTTSHYLFVFFFAIFQIEDNLLVLEFGRLLALCPSPSSQSSRISNYFKITGKLHSQFTRRTHTDIDSHTHTHTDAEKPFNHRGKFWVFTVRKFVSKIGVQVQIHWGGGLLLLRTVTSPSNMLNRETG